MCWLGWYLFLTRLLERADRLPTLTQRGRGGLGASAECCRWYFFSQTPEPNLALISRKDFGCKVDGREIGARFYGMSSDPQPIRTGLRGIIVDPNKKGSRREVSALRLTHNEKKTVQHCAECKVIVCNAMERRPFCDSGSVRGESVGPPSQTGWAGWADHYSGLGLHSLRSGVQTVVQTVETESSVVVCPACPACLAGRLSASPRTLPESQNGQRSIALHTITLHSAQCWEVFF